MKKITIEELLTWAFTVELPKAFRGDDGPSGYDGSAYAFDQVALLGCMVDGNGTPWHQLKTEIPHADAIAVGEAVSRLEERTFDIGSGWNPFPEWTDELGLISAEVARIAAEEASRGESAGIHIASLVTSSAILKRGPEWQADEPRIVAVTRSGKPAWFVRRKYRNGLGHMVEYEDNGIDRRTGRPMKDAYRKYKLDEPIRAAVIGRMEWQLWQSALGELRDSLRRRLEAHDLLPFRPNMHPWLTLQNSTDLRKPLEYKINKLQSAD